MSARNSDRSPCRKRRVDAQRNRTRLLEAAKSVFATQGTDVSLEEIARSAGVGIGTLYRNFATRCELIEAVYRREVEQLAGSAPRLIASHTSVEALREWLRLFVDYMATKKVMVSALNAMVGDASSLYAHSRSQLRSAMEALIDNARHHGTIEFEGDPFDLLRALVGVTNVDDTADWKIRSHRMIDILIAGLRPRAA